MKGRKIKIFYEDGTGRVSRIDGICTEYSNDVILDERILIPRNRVVRIELV